MPLCFEIGFEGGGLGGKPLRWNVQSKGWCAEVVLRQRTSGERQRYQTSVACDLPRFKYT